MYSKKCDYCHEPVSVLESEMEFGKHYHDSCMIHKLQSEIENYKKKWINGKMTPGDKEDLVDKYQLSRTLMSEKTEFRGWKQVAEIHRATRKTTEKLLLSDSYGFPILDMAGKPIVVEEESPACEVTYARMRPNTVTTKVAISKNQLENEQILQICGRSVLDYKEEDRKQNVALISKENRKDQVTRPKVLGLKPHCTLMPRYCYCSWDGKVKKCEVGRSTSDQDEICATTCILDEPIKINSLSNQKIKALAMV
jgi:hypothetical protein